MCPMQDILMPNEDFEPSEDCERVLECSKRIERQGNRGDAQIRAT